MAYDIRLSLEEGKKLFQQGEHARALMTFNCALEQAPCDSALLFEAGKAHCALGDYAKAVDCLQKSRCYLARDCAWKRHVFLLLSKAYCNLKKYREAAHVLQELLDGETEDRDAIATELREITRRMYANSIDRGRLTGDRNALIGQYLLRLEDAQPDANTVIELAQIYNFAGEYRQSEILLDAHIGLVDDDAFLKNKFVNELEIARGKTVLDSRVRSLSVTLSNRCNISCTMCRTSKHPWELPEKRREEIVALAPFLEKVMWQGGEVFMLPYFMELVRELFKYPQLRQSIVTNGQLITEEIAEELVKNNVELTFSIDGATKKIYESIRRGASFEKLMRSLTSVARLRTQYGSSFALNMNVAVMASNYRELRSLAELAAANGVNFICFMPVNISPDAHSDEDIFADSDREILERVTRESDAVAAVAAKYGIRFENRLPLLRPMPTDSENNSGEIKRQLGEKTVCRKRICHVPWYQLLLDYDGTVRPDCQCSIHKNAGSLKEFSIAEMWNNEVMQEYRRRIVEHRHDDLCSQNCLSGKIAEEHLKIV